MSHANWKASTPSATQISRQLKSSQWYAMRIILFLATLRLAPQYLELYKPNKTAYRHHFAVICSILISFELTNIPHHIRQCFQTRFDRAIIIVIAMAVLTKHKKNKYLFSDCAVHHICIMQIHDKYKHN